MYQQTFALFDVLKNFDFSFSYVLHIMYIVYINIYKYNNSILGMSFF